MPSASPNLWKEKRGHYTFKQPREGIQGLHPEQIVWIINGVYGLVDAPLHWRKSLVQDLESLGYRASRMDPCLFLLFNKGSGLEGAIAVEVDDLFTVGHARHHEQMEKLQKKYTFGKYVQLRGDEQGASFNGRRIRQQPDGGFLIDMQKFVEERLNPIVLQKGRASQKKDPVTEEERGQARAVCGALNWLSKEGRLRSTRRFRSIFLDVVTVGYTEGGGLDAYQRGYEESEGKCKGSSEDSTTTEHGGECHY